MALSDTRQVFRRIIDPFPISIDSYIFEKIKLLHALKRDLVFFRNWEKKGVTTYTKVVAFSRLQSNHFLSLGSYLR